ncbi:MAG TPA: hypothetical protein VL171_17560 [Verrucomicrobiae bacterium]|nr:hypothetical protein [Verrucomicrobiae bacterium]
MKFKHQPGQSVAEYAVLLALLIIVVTTVLIGIGHHSRVRLANVNGGFNDQGAASAASAGSAGGGVAR